jgi:hypothetical protein
MLLVMLSVGSNERLHITVPTNGKGENTNSNERLHITVPTNGKGDNTNSKVFNPRPPPKKV